MSNTLNNVIRFQDVANQTTGDITRVIGFVPSRHIYALFDNPAIDANPRRPKANRVTADILQTLENSPELFHFKSKGILLGTSSYDVLQRNRYQLNFQDLSSEGVLDGGHNMLSIGLHFLSHVMDKREHAKIKEWDDLLEAWEANRKELEEVRDKDSFLIPVELLIPANSEAETIASFKVAIIDICASRNNNAQLAQEAKANQRGLYKEIKARFKNEDCGLYERVEWKTNQWEDSETVRPVRVRDIVAMSWLPLNVLANNGFLDGERRVNPVKIYSSKDACSRAFDDLYQDGRVSDLTDEGKYELKNTAVGSALDILVELPWLYDWVVEFLPSAYNKNNGKFGRIDAVKMGNFRTPFYDQPVEYKVPDGFVVPLFYGLVSLMKVENDKVCWAVDPIDFLDRNFEQIVGGYRMALDMASFDPQKVAKNENAYNLAMQQFEFALMKEDVAA
jgi:AIPR protein